MDSDTSRVRDTVYLSYSLEFKALPRDRFLKVKKAFMLPQTSKNLRRHSPFPVHHCHQASSPLTMGLGSLLSLLYGPKEVQGHKIHS